MPTYLVESDARQFLSNSLRNCHAIKMRYYSMIVNTVLVLAMIVCFGYALYSRWRLGDDGIDPEKLAQEKEMMRQKHIISRIRHYTTPAQSQSQSQSRPSDESDSSDIASLPAIL